MFAAILILFVLPWLDTSRVRSANFRPIYRWFVWLFGLNAILLGYCGAMPAEGIWLVLARIGTAYYFAHFLLVAPLVGWFERTPPMPTSIAKPVLGGASA